jgi:hypothetical protein
MTNEFQYVITAGDVALSTLAIFASIGLWLVIIGVFVFREGTQ